MWKAVMEFEWCFVLLLGISVVNAEAVGPNSSNVAILSATSSGNETGAVTLTITYSAPLEHATHWEFYYSTKAMGNWIRTAGTKRHLNDSTYSSTVTMPTQGLYDFATIRLYGGDWTVSAYIDVRSVVWPSEVTLPEAGYPILSSNASNADSANGDVNFAFVFKHGFVFDRLIYKGIETNGATSKVITEYDTYSPEAIDIRNYPGVGTTTYVVTLKRPYPDLGGVLQFRSKMDLSRISQSLLRFVAYRYAVPVPPVGIHENTVAIMTTWYPEWRGHYIKMTTPRYGLECKAIGNPLPYVRIFKVSDDEDMTQVPTVSLVYKGVQQAVAIHELDASQAETPGHYLCRAESGTAVAEARARVEVDTE